MDTRVLTSVIIYIYQLKEGLFLKQILSIAERYNFSEQYTDKEEAKNNTSTGQVVISDQKGLFYIILQEVYYNGPYQLGYKIV